MNKTAFIVYIGMFLALPPALLMTRLFDKARMPWIFLLAVSAIVGWSLVNLAHMFYFNGLLVQWATTANAPRPTHGYPKDDFLFRFGWLLGLAYLVPWLMLYCGFVFVRWMLGHRGAWVRRR